MRRLPALCLLAVLAAAACGSAPTADPSTGPRPGEAGAAGGEDAAGQEQAARSCDDEPAGCYGSPQRAGAFPVERIPGASGLAASRRNPGVLYAVDDQEGTREVWALAEDGALLGAVGVEGLDARNTEDLAVGPCSAGDERTCVYVADIGNNLRLRETVSVYRFVEPDLEAGVPGTPLPADVAHLRYPDEPPDAEALIVDDRGDLFLVTKADFDAAERRTGETRLYRAAGFSDQALESLGAVPVPAPERPMHSLVVGDVVTAGDFRDGRVLLRTYDQVIEYRPGVQGSTVADLADWEHRAVPAPLEAQSEALAWAADGCGFFTAGEGAGDLWRVPCRGDADG